MAGGKRSTWSNCTGRARRAVRRGRFGGSGNRRAGWLAAEYHYPDGYQAPPGTKWNPDLLWAEFYSRNPIRSRVQVIKRGR